MENLAALAPATQAPPPPPPPPRRDIDVILAASYAAARQMMRREEEERLAEAGLIQFTALPEPRTAAAPRTTAAAARPWRCRLCQVDCGGRGGFTEHCMSDEHYAGLQLFALHSDLFTDPF